jgi:hypothetical protein
VTTEQNIDLRGMRGQNRPLTEEVIRTELEDSRIRVDYFDTHLLEDGPTTGLVQTCEQIQGKRL